MIGPKDNLWAIRELNAPQKLFKRDFPLWEKSGALYQGTASAVP
jgi:hypothetical protein